MSDNPTANTATAENSADINNENLASTLAKLAALLGKAVPLHRFSMQQNDDGGLSLSLLPLGDQVAAMWRSRFPTAEIDSIDYNRLHQRDFPLLWLNPITHKAYILLGQLANGECLVQPDNSVDTPKQLNQETLLDGFILKLSLGQQFQQGEKSRPKSAKDWFFFCIRKNWHVFAEGVFATFIISCLALFTSLYTMQVYDRVVPSKGFSTLWVLTSGVLMAIMLEFLMKQARAYIVELSSKRIDLELADVFFNKALSIRMDARPSTVGTFASQIRHFESVRSFMTSSTLFILADAPFALFFLFVIALLAGPVALVPAVMIPIAIFSGWLSSRKMDKYSAQHMEESNKKNGLLIEAVDGIESIKAAGASWKQRDRYNNLTKIMSENDIHIRQLSTRATNISQSIQQLNYVALIAAGAYAITSGSLTMGGLIACSILVGRALTPISQIPSLISQWSSAKIALATLDQIMAMPSDREDDVRLTVPSSCSGLISLENIKFAYSKDAPALDIESLIIKPKQKIAVVGAIGSGKSTLVKLLSGLYQANEGKIALDNIEMTNLDEDFLREKIGYLPQDVRLFSGTLRENLVLGVPTPSDERILYAAKLSGLDSIIANHPKGLELVISEGGRGLSGGQRQLVGLTRMLIRAPSILLLDEPTASMDAKLEIKVMKHLFEEIDDDAVVVVVTHKPSVLSHVDRIIVMDKGKVVMDDDRDKVLALMRKPLASEIKAA